MKNETPTQPIEHTKLQKNSYHSKFYHKVSFVIWPTLAKKKQFTFIFHQIDPSVGYISRKSAKIHTENKNTIHQLSNYVGKAKDIHIDQ